MKTNPVARRLLRLRFILLCAAIATLLGLEVYWGADFVARIGQSNVIPTQIPAAPNMDLGDLMAAVR